MANFKKVHCGVEQPIYPGQKNVKVEWEFEDLKLSDIELNEQGKPAVIPGCGCTADVVVTEKGITAYYTDSTSIATVKKSPNSRMNVGKNLRVYLKDGNPLMVTGSRGVKVPNVNGKKNLLITFGVIVKV